MLRAETKKGSLVLPWEPAEPVLSLDQRLEHLPPRASPRSTIGLIVDGHIP